MEELLFYICDAEEYKNLVIEEFKRESAKVPEYLKQNEEYVNFVNEFQNTINNRQKEIDYLRSVFSNVENETARKIMLLKSEKDLSFEEISEKVGYCERYCKMLFAKGLKELEAKGFCFARYEKGNLFVR